MSIQMPPSESEQLAQLNQRAMRDVATGGVTEMATDPAMQVAGKIPQAALDALLSVFTGKSTRRPTGEIGDKPRVLAEGNIESPDLNYKKTQTKAAKKNMSEEGLAKFQAQGNQATDLSPAGQRQAAALADADEALEASAEDQLKATVVDARRGVSADQRGAEVTEDSAGLASESQAAEVLENVNLGASYLKSIEDGAPFNWDNLKTPDDVKTLINAVSESLPDQQQAATRGVVTNEETLDAAIGQLSDTIGVTRNILKRQIGTSFKNAADATAARMLLVDSATKLEELATRVAQGDATNRDMLQFRRQLAIHNGIQLQIKGAQTEAARILQSFNIPVSEGMSKEASALINADVIEISGGAKTMQQAAKGLLLAKKNGGDAAFNEAAQKGIMSKFKNGVEHLYINGLLSGPKTQFKNVVGNLLFGMMQVPEEFIAGIYGTGERAIMRAAGKEIDYTKQVYMSDVAHRFTGYAVSFVDALRAAREAFVTGEAGDAVNKAEFNTYRTGNVGALTGGRSTAIDNVFSNAMLYLHNFSGIPTRLLLAGDDLFKVLSQNGELHAMANRQRKAALAAGMTKQAAKEEGLMVINSPRQFAEELDVKSRHDTLMSDTGAIGQAASSLQNTWFGRYILPFATAPTNDILRTFERTPLGLLHKDMIGKDASKRQIRIARMAFTGVAMSQVAMFAGMGHITGGIPQTNSGYTDKRKREKLPPGWQPYSFVTRGEGFPTDENGEPLELYDQFGAPNGPLEYTSYAGLGPLASVIGLTAAAVQHSSLATSAEERQYVVFGAVLASMGYFRELPFLKGMADVISAMTKGDANYLTSGPMGSMNLVPGVPNPASALTRTIERIGDNTVTKAGADFEIYTIDEVRTLTDQRVLKPNQDGSYPYDLVGMPKTEASLKFTELMSNWRYQAIATNPFVDDINAEIPQYDTLGRLKTDGPTFQEAPGIRLWNAISPITISSSEAQPDYVKELIRLDWPIPQAPKEYKGVALTPLQESNFVWLAKGSKDDMPTNLEGLDKNPVRVRVKGMGFVTYNQALEALMRPTNPRYRKANNKEKRSLIRSLNDQFFEAAWPRLMSIPENDRLPRAARAIQMLKDRGMR